MSRLAVFGYASLASPASASETLGRPVEIAAIARLRGWSRAWTLGRDNLASEKTFARGDGSLPPFCLGLNLEPDPAAPAPNGVLIELSEAELERLDLREMRYDRVDVTDAVTIDRGGPEPHGFDLVVAYSAKPAHHHPTAPPGAVIVVDLPVGDRSGLRRPRARPARALSPNDRPRARRARRGDAGPRPDPAGEPAGVVSNRGRRRRLRATRR